MKLRKKLSLLLQFTYFLLATGVLSELVLLAHYENKWQQLPILLTIVAILSMTFYLRLPKKWTTVTLKSVLLLLILSGFTGMYLHLDNNLHFEKELHPDLHINQLIWNTLLGAIPVNAPGAMIVLGLVGYSVILIKNI